MEHFLIYILKSAGLTAVFLTVYLLLLRKDTSFHLNRFYLLCGIFISFSLPAFELTRQVFIEAPVLTSTLSGNIPAMTGDLPATGPETDWWQLACIIYFAGLSFFLIRFVIQLLSLFSFLRLEVRQRKNGLMYYPTTRKIQPFSFFRHIVFNPAAHPEQELDLILRHETAHARQWHSVDVLVTNLTAAVLWFNPLIWIYKKYLLQNLEYLADRETVIHTGSRKEYQKALVRATVGNLQPVLANHFYQSLIKKRIIMLNKTTASKQNFWKTGLVLPLLAGFFFLFQVNTEAQVMPTTQQDTNKGTGEGEFAVTVNATANAETLAALETLFDTRRIKLTFDKVDRTEEGLISNIAVSFISATSGKSGNYNQHNAAGISPFTFYSNYNGETGFRPAREDQEGAKGDSASNSLQELGENVLIVLGDVVYESSELDGNYIQVNGDFQVLKAPEAAKKLNRKAPDGAIIIPDGKLIKDFRAAMRQVDEQVEEASYRYIRIQKGQPPMLATVKKSTSTGKSQKEQDRKEFEESIYRSAETSTDSLTFIQKWAENKPETIYMNAVQYENNNTIYRSSLNNSSQQPLYVVDGKVQGKDFNPGNIDPNEIKSINVLKDKSATEKYGEQGKNGVIEINLKSEAEMEEGNELSGRVSGENATSITIKSADSSSKDSKTLTITGTGHKGLSGSDSPLYVLDGKEMGKDFNADSIAPQDIDNIVVLKGDKAIEKYGKKAANGVVEINLKN